jgi:hypothetical protein
MITKLANSPQDGISFVELDWYADNETVVVTPRDQQRFDISKDRAIEILRVTAAAQARFNKQMNLVINILGKWIADRAGEIRDAYLTVQDNSFLFVVVKKTAPVDPQFEDELSELDFSIANDQALDLLHVHTLSVPPVGENALKSFIDPRAVYAFHGRRS